MNTTNEQKVDKKSLLSKGWTYLNDNFHKFTEDNKIRIALELVKKDMPTQIEGELNSNITHMDRVIKDGKPMEHNVGT